MKNNINEVNCKTEYAKKYNLEFEDYNGWCNRDTWLVMLWLGNDQNNYEGITRIVNNTHELKDLSDLELYMILKDFNYSNDKIDFTRVDLDEVRFGLTEK